MSMPSLDSVFQPSPPTRPPSIASAVSDSKQSLRVAPDVDTESTRPSETPTRLQTPSIQSAETGFSNHTVGGTLAPSLSHVYPPAPVASVSTERALAPLPPADRGRDAYLFLAAAFVVETVIWGAPSSYGVFLQFYQTRGVGTDGNTTGASLLPLVGTLASGAMYFLGTPVALVLNPRPRWRLPAVRLGAALATLGLLLSAWAKTPLQLLLTQGMLYSVGGALVYYPTFSFLSEWFVSRRGFANGVCFAGTAAGGLVYPFALNWLLTSYGSQRTLQVLAATTALLLAASLPLLRPRIPVGRALSGSVSRREHQSGSGDRKKAFKSVRLWTFLLANVAQAFGFFLPTLYLPTFATSLGLSTAEGSGLLAGVNAGSVFSRVALGVLSDKVSPHVLGTFTMMASSLSVIILWGVTSTSFAPLLVFALVLGLVAGGWTSLYSSIIRDAAKDDPILASTLFGVVSLTRGVGSILTAPVSSFLLSHPLHGASLKTGFGVADGRFGALVVFAGIALAVAAGMEGVASM